MPRHPVTVSPLRAVLSLLSSPAGLPSVPEPPSSGHRILPRTGEREKTKAPHSAQTHTLASRTSRQCRPVSFPSVACPSGRRSAPRKRVTVHPVRGFKSHRYRSEQPKRRSPCSTVVGVLQLVAVLVAVEGKHATRRSCSSHHGRGPPCRHTLSGHHGPLRLACSDSLYLFKADALRAPAGPLCRRPTRRCALGMRLPPGPSARRPGRGGPRCARASLAPSKRRPAIGSEIELALYTRSCSPRRTSNARVDEAGPTATRALELTTRTMST